MEITVLGLSVAEEKQGYAHKLISYFGDGAVSKIVLGGMHPNQVLFHFFKLLNTITSQYIVVEWCTSAFRGGIKKKSIAYL